ncbi:putative ATP-grasp-modified RiPP [Streptomyces massasporeus]|uniref:ATP-grasp-modified RiPP n=2 Tax=Streptomyces massasporeus TaxID=67324 RepID=A0ABW6L6M4_9ACTN
MPMPFACSVSASARSCCELKPAATRAALSRTLPVGLGMSHLLLLTAPQPSHASPLQDTQSTPGRYPRPLDVRSTASQSPRIGTSVSGVCGPVRTAGQQREHAVYTHEGLGGGVSQWLARTHPVPERVWTEWATQGVALLPLGERFAAVRMASEIVHAAVRSEDQDDVAAELGDLLGGGIIFDRRGAGGTYYALVDGHARFTWAHDDVGTCLGRGTYLGVPRVDRRQPPGTYWVVPPRHEGDLCHPPSVLGLLEAGRARQAAERESRSHNGGELMTAVVVRGPWAMRLVTDRLPVRPPSYVSVVLDGPSQTARYRGTDGRVVEMGKHGTSRTTGTASVSGGGDGQNPQPQTQDDHTTDYESD